ncbi:ICOS ligand-like [Rhinoraja longicauda]
MKGCFFAVCLAIVSPLLYDTLRAEGVQVLGYVGERVMLPCAYAAAGKRPGRSVVVSWQRGNAVVHAQRWDGPMNGLQDPFFRNRTALSRGEFERGSFSLSLGPLSPRDEGRYDCIVLHGPVGDVQQTDVQLVVAGELVEQRRLITLTATSATFNL